METLLVAMIFNLNHLNKMNTKYYNFYVLSLKFMFYVLSFITLW